MSFHTRSLCLLLAFYLLLPVLSTSALAVAIKSSPVSHSRPPDSLSSTQIPPSTPLLLLQVKTNPSGNAQISFRKSQGPAPTLRSEYPAYQALFLDGSGQTIQVSDFDKPEMLVEETNTPRRTPIAQFTVPLSIPDQAQQVVVQTLEGQTLAQSRLDNLPTIKPAKSYQAILGSELVLPNSSSSVLGFTTTPDFVDFVFISQGFAPDQMAEFHLAVDSFITTLLSYEPYASRIDQFIFYFLENTTDLGCTSPTSCQGDYVDRTYQVVLNSEVPYDVGSLVINSTSTGGSAGTTVLPLTVTGKSYPHIFVHEVAHILGGLTDEYLSPANAGLDGPTYQTPNQNCFRGQPPSRSWHTIVGIPDYALGCGYQNYYRSYPSNLMLGSSSGNYFFSGLQHQLIGYDISRYAGVSPDPTPPQISITSPLHGSVVNQSTPVSIHTSDNRQVTLVQYWLNGQLLTTDPVAPFEYTLASGLLQNSWNRLTVRVFDAAGHMALDVAYIHPTSNSNPPAQKPVSEDYLRTLTLPAIQSTYINASSPLANYSTSTSLVIAGGTAPKTAFLQYDLSAVTGKPITNVQLRVIPSQDATNATTQAYFVSDNTWQASNLTYSSHPALTESWGTLPGVGRQYESLLDLTSRLQSYSSTALSLSLVGTTTTTLYTQSTRSTFAFSQSPVLEITYLDQAGDIPTPTPSYNIADINRDGVVDLGDFSILSQQFLRQGSDLSADLNKDQIVDLTDFSILSLNFLKTS